MGSYNLDKHSSASDAHTCFGKLPNTVTSVAVWKNSQLYPSFHGSWAESYSYIRLLGHLQPANSLEELYWILVNLSLHVHMPSCSLASVTRITKHMVVTGRRKKFLYLSPLFGKPLFETSTMHIPCIRRMVYVTQASMAVKFVPK